MMAQIVQILDKTTLRPLEFVTITDEKMDLSAITNQKGEADISVLKDATTIIFRFVGYRELNTTYTEATNMRVLYMEPKFFSLEGVVVSANRWEQDRKEVANHITSIPALEVAFYNPQTSADMLAQSGQVFVQKSQFGGGSPMIRGFATNRLLMVVDGVRMNTAILRSGNIQNVISIDPNNLEGTEIIFGPGSVIYGSDALGGVMDFHTLKPKLSNGDSLIFSGNAMARYASANFEKTGHVDFNIGLNKWAFTTGFSFSDFDDLRMGSNGPDEYLRPEYVEVIDGIDSIIPNDNDQIQVPTDMQLFNIMQKVRFKPDEQWDIEFGFHYSETSDYDRYDRLIEYRDGLPRSAVWFYGPQIWNMDVLSISHNGNKKIYDAAKLTFAYQFFEESRNDRSYQGGTFRSRTEQVDAYSLNLDLNKSIGLATIYYGLEAIYNRVTSMGTDTKVATGISEPGPTRYPDGSNWQSYAAYVSAKWKLKQNLTLQTGLRYNQVITIATFDTTFYPFPFTDVQLNNGALSGSVGMAWLPASDFQINVNLSSGFRAPNIDDIGKVFDSEPGNVTVPNPELEPEYAYNAELGIVKNFGSMVEFQITGFYTYLDNAIVRRDYTLNGEDSILYDGELSQVQALQNIDNAFVYGIESGIRIQPLENFTIASYLTYTKGEEQAEESGDAYVPMRHAPPLFGSTHLIYQVKKMMVDFYTDYNSEIPFEELAPSEANKPHLYAVDESGNPYCPGWSTINLKVGYQVLDNLNMQAGVENILDKRYRPYSSGMVSPGINFILSLRAHF